jgi:hypothetical protein
MAGGYTYNIWHNPNEQQPQDQHQPQQALPIDKSVGNKLVEAQSRNIEAIARINEAQAKTAEAQAIMAQAQILLNGMAELRMALHMPSVDEDQNAVTEKTTLKPMFTEDHVQNIQINYMVLYKKYEEFTGDVIKKYTKELNDGL